MVNALTTTTTTFTGDVENTITQTANNSNSPGATDLVTLASGANTITVPTGGAVCERVTIVMPCMNAIAVHLKGVTGDTGILLNLVGATVLTLDPTQASFVLTAGAQLVGVRFIWA